MDEGGHILGELGVGDDACGTGLERAGAQVQVFMGAEGQDGVVGVVGEADGLFPIDAAGSDIDDDQRGSNGCQILLERWEVACNGYLVVVVAQGITYFDREEQVFFECEDSCGHGWSILRAFVNRTAEEITQFLVDEIGVGVEIGCEHMATIDAVGFIAGFIMAGFEDQIAVFHRDPDVFA